MSQTRLRPPRYGFSTSFKAWLFSPVILLGLSAGRLLLVANYDTTTAMTISSTVGAISTLLGTMIPILSAYLPALTLFFAVIRSWRSAFVAGGGALFVSPAHATFTEALVGARNQILSWVVGVSDEWTHLLDRSDMWWVGGYAALWVVTGWALMQWPPSAYAFYIIEPDEEDDDEPEHDPSWAALGQVLVSAVVFLFGVVLFLFVQNAYAMTFTLTQFSHTVRLPWMPPEEITVEHQAVEGQEDGHNETSTQVAYVLSVTGEWTILLQEDSRTISYVPSSDVKARKVCQLPATSTANDPPLLKLHGVERPELERCQGS